MNTIDYFAECPKPFELLQEVHAILESTGLDSGLAAMAVLRSSQINGCGYCVNLHLGEARKAGVSNEKLDQLVVWRQVDLFSAAEKSVFEWFEALTVLKPDTNYETLRSQLQTHFSNKDISAFTVVAGMINLWNRIQISNH